MDGSAGKNSILFLAAGSRTLGLGHLSRCNVLADCLKDYRCRFVIEHDPAAENYLKSLGKPFEIVRSIERDTLALIGKYSPCAVVLDRKDNPAELVEQIRNRRAAVVDIEDLGEGRLRADYLIDPHVWPGSGESAYSGRAVTCFGPDWVIIHPAYARLRNRLLNNRTIEKKAERGNEPVKVIVSCGGSDPAGILDRVVESFDLIGNHRFELTVVAGHAAGADGSKNGKHKINRLKNVRTLAPLVYGAELAVVSGGISMLEALCLGLPTIVAPQNEEQKINSARFAGRGAALLGPLPDESGYCDKLAGLVDKILADRELYLRLASNGINLIDGLGAKRVSEIIRNIKI